jgi:hypothetical protein
MQAHSTHIEKYCGAGRALGVVVSIAVVADLSEERVRISNARQSTLWWSTAMAPEQLMVARRFFAELDAGAA